jgi:hypothetical protein
MAYLSDIKSNNAGQVRVKYNGTLMVSGVTANAQVYPNIRGATPEVSAAPTTKWPKQSITDGVDNYAAGFYVQGSPSDGSGDRLRENNVPGQVHRWRFICKYQNKDTANTGGVFFVLTNPASGFTVSGEVTLPSGSTQGDITAEVTTIADTASMAVGAGYRLYVMTTFTDASLQIIFDSITRISEAVDP